MLRLAVQAHPSGAVQVSTVPKRQGLRIVLVCVLTAIAMKAATEAYKARMRPIWDYHAYLKGGTEDFARCVKLRGYDRCVEPD